MFVEDAIERYTSYKKPDEYIYNALQYIDGFEALCGTPNHVTSVLDMAIGQPQNLLPFVYFIFIDLLLLVFCPWSFTTGPSLPVFCFES